MKMIFAALLSLLSTASFAGLDLAMAEIIKEASAEMEQQYMEKALAMCSASRSKELRCWLPSWRTGCRRQHESAFYLMALPFLEKHL